MPSQVNVKRCKAATCAQAFAVRCQLYYAITASYEARIDFSVVYRQVAFAPCRTVIRIRDRRQEFSRRTLSRHALFWRRGNASFWFREWSGPKIDRFDLCLSSYDPEFGPECPACTTHARICASDS